MTTVAELRKRLRGFVAAHTGAKPERIAELFIQSCRKADLVPLLVEEVKWLERAGVRLAEISVLSASVPVRPTQTLGTIRSGLGDLAALLDEPYRIGDGVVRRFGALTVEEHRTRILMLEANIAGLARDVAIHQQAIDFCEQHGVSSLDEIAVGVAA